MKTITLTLSIILLLLAIACSGANENKAVKTPLRAEPTPVPTSTIPKDGDYPAKGKVTKINNELGSIELDHEEIVGVMPRMIMEFYVKNKAELKPLKVGDQVDFVLEYKHPTETIVSIKKAK